MIAKTLLVAVTLYVVLGAALYLAQRHILFMPDTTRPDPTAVNLPTLQQLPLTTPDGLTLLAWYLPAKPGRPTLAYFHGNGGNLANRTNRIRRFAETGLGLLMPEYRGYGGNPGSPSEVGFALDAAAAMDALAALGIPPERTILYGESIGTGVAVRVATQYPVAALILESPYTSITAIAQRRYWFLPVALLIRDPFDSLSRIRQIESPLLILQGARDTIVPPELGQALYAAAPDPKRLWTTPDAGHNDLMQHGAFDVVMAFIDRLPPAR